MIDVFRNEHWFLCNFFYPCEVEFEGLVYPSSEHAFQAAKTLNLKLRKIFTLKEMTPAQSKYLGREIKMRPDWEAVKDDIMYRCVLAKFEDPILRQRLLDTGDQELIEGNTWGDTYWGVCKGKGRNMLGKTLMAVRKYYNGI